MNLIATCSIKDAATILGVSEQTVRQMEIDGKLISKRTSGGHRIYEYSELERVIANGFELL